MDEPSAQVQTDLTAGVSAGSLPDGGILAGRVGEDDVVLVRAGGRFFAVGAHCTHYHGPLADGLVVGDTIRCPLHHACFSLRTGDALRAPALDPIACWRVEERDGLVFVRGKIARAPQPEPVAETAAATPRTAASPPATTKSFRAPSSIVIVGGGAAGLAAADMLRREGYDGPVTMISADADAPVDRPNLSKDYLSGDAPEEWLPLWPTELYTERRIDLVLGRRAVALDPTARVLVLDDGSRREFGTLLLATGAEPVRLPLPGADETRCFYLRTLTDARAIIARAKASKRAVVAGASFIGLEVAASLRALGLTVDVVAPSSVPFDRVMGTEMGRFVQTVHEAHGVRFHLGQTVASADGPRVTLSGGTTIDTDLVVLGVGVRPVTALAEQARLSTDRGISVNPYLETSAPGIFAAGDVARWPDPHTGDRIRVEHWVVAERQGQVAARNMLGRRETFDAVPFFWSQHYDVTIRYVGHAERWDSVHIDGSLGGGDCAVAYLRNGKRVAAATVGRNRESLTVEAEMERGG